MIKEWIKSIIRLFGYDICKLNKENIIFTNPFETQKRLLIDVNKPTIFDIGAFHGDVVAAYRTLFPEATIYCFEPFNDSFGVLKRRFIGDQYIKLFRLAVCNKTGVEEFFVNNVVATNSLLPRPIALRRYYPKNSGMKMLTEVHTTSLDDFLEIEEEVDEIDILKLDIQGGELMALRGAEKTLRHKKVSLIYIEIMFVPHYEGGALFNELWDFLRDFKYSLFNIYNLRMAKNGQLRYGDAIFVSDELRSNVIDRFDEEP